MTEWDTCTLGHLVDVTGGSIKTGPFGTTLKAAEYTTIGAPVISTGEVRYGTFQISEKTPHLGRETVARLSEYLLEENDLVFARKGSIDRSARVKADESGYFLGSDALRVRLGPGVDSRFVGYQLLTARVKSWLGQHAGGTTMPSLNQAILSRIPMSFPPLDEQRRIAAVLGALDDLIETNRSRVANLEELARTIAATSTRDVPLAECARTAKFKQVKPSGPVEHYSLPAFDDGVEPERVDGTVIQSNKLRLTQPCVLVSRLNPKWERCWMAYPGPNAVASTEFVPLVGVGASPEEVWAVASSSAFWDQMRMHVTGTTGSHQRVDKAAVLTLAVPDVRALADLTRKQIATLVWSARAARDEIGELTTARDELLPLLMSGEVRVADVEAA